MERIDIRYALAEVARDKRFVESLQWRSEEIFFAQENLAACVVDGTHTIKTWTWFMKWNTYQGHEFEKTFNFTIVLFALRRRPEVCCLCLVNAVENVSVQFVFWSLGPLSKTCLVQKRLPLSAVKVFHVRCDRWCLYSWGEDKTWTRGPWTPTLDQVHGPLSWTGSMDPLSWTGSMDSFFLIMRNEQKQK